MKLELEWMWWRMIDCWEAIKEMAWMATFVILIVLLCRLLLRKVSSKMCYLLWAVVAIRLICPVYLPSEFSLFNVVGDGQVLEMLEQSRNTENSISENLSVLEQDISLNTQKLSQNNVSTFPNSAQQSEISGTSETFEKMENAEHEEVYQGAATGSTSVGFYLKILFGRWQMLCWLTGMFFMMLYGVISYIRMKKKLRFATKTTEGVYECEGIASPFVMGIFCPKIYLPYHLTETERFYIIRHESYHIRRRDYLIKMAAFLLLCIYWFHPLVWVSFFLMNRDMEMSCDAHVLKDMSAYDRKVYSTLLLNFGSEKHFPMPSPLAFGENDTKSRVKQILNGKKPAAWLVVLAVLAISLTMVFCLTSQSQKNSADNFETGNTDALEQGGNGEAKVSELAEELFRHKNPYIGDVSANGQIIGILCEELGMSASYGVELQTTEEPYWITLHFDEKPEEKALWKAAGIFLALVDNCSEFRWDYPENSMVYTYYVRTEDFDSLLEEGDIKAYGESPEMLQKLLDFLEIEEGAVLSSTWDFVANRAELEDAERKNWENRFIRDNISYRGNSRVVDCVCEDFDKSGQKDLCLLTVDETEAFSTLYFYMNDAPVYEVRIPEVSCYSVEITPGDVDHDGNTELLYLAYTGGNGGSGSYAKGMFKFVNDILEPMMLPGDFSEEEKEWFDEGFHLEVSYAEGEGKYLVTCSSIGESLEIQSAYSTYEDGSFFDKEHIPGTVIGANCRGYYDMSIEIIDGQEYLVAEEYFYGEAGINDGKGFAEFVFDWDENGNWFVKDFEVTAYSYD